MQSCQSDEDLLEQDTDRARSSGGNARNIIIEPIWNIQALVEEEWNRSARPGKVKIDTHEHITVCSGGLQT